MLHLWSLQADISHHVANHMVISAAVVVIEEVFEVKQALLGLADWTIHVIQLLLNIKVEKSEALSSPQLDVLASTVVVLRITL